MKAGKAERYEDLGITLDTIIIVYVKKNEEFAAQLGQFIHGSSGHETAEWETKHWEANKPLITSSQKVIFWGEAGKSQTVAVKWIFDEFSMRYGYLGSRCVLDVGSLDTNKVKDFKQHYEKRAKHFSADIDEKAKGGRLGNDKLPFVAPVFFALPVIAALVIDKAMLEQLKKSQYQLLICEFVLGGGLKKFVEGE